MNTRLTTAAALISALFTTFAAPLAMAQEATPDTWQVVNTTLSREAVRADAVAALKAGLIERGEASVDHSNFRPTLSRVQVAAEAREALRLGVLSFGEGPAYQATPAQADAIRMAGLKAIGQTTVAQASR
jgi:purine nucleoside phosphorylase